MKILYRNRSFRGGAPRSLLEYSKLAKKNGIEVIAVGQFDTYPSFYIDNDIEVIDTPYFVLGRPLYSYFQLMKYIKLIKYEKPDIIHTITPENSLFHNIINDTMKIPIIHTIPGGEVSRYISQLLIGNHLIVFSEENKMDLIKYGHHPQNITVISNRIHFSNEEDDSEYFYSQLKDSTDKKLRLLAISRLDKSKINSLIYVINLADKLANDFDIKLSVLGDGEYFNDLVELARKTNNKHHKKIIYLEGHQENVNEYIKHSHIIFGKGRSVLDGIMNNRLSVVINEIDEMCLCCEDTFDNLRTYNFTARNLNNELSYNELTKIITSLNNNSFDYSTIGKLKEITRTFYDISHAEKKILNLYKIETDNPNFNPNFLKIFFRYVCFYVDSINLKYKLIRKKMFKA